MKVNVKKLRPDAKIPKYASPGDAGLDLTATTYSYNVLHRFHEYGTGLAVAIPEGHMGLIFPRSSISKKSLALANAVGVIDSGYRGEVKLRFTDVDQFGSVYAVGDKIAQLIIVPYPSIELNEVTDLDETSRGEGGFGSTGE